MNAAKAIFLLVALVGISTFAAQHGVTTALSEIGSQVCSASNTFLIPVSGVLVTGVQISGDLVGKTNRIVPPCAVNGLSGLDAIYEFNPSQTGYYRFEVTATPDLLVFVTHCNSVTLYSSGYYESDAYVDACADDPPTMETVLFAGSKYYVIVSPYSESLTAATFLLRATFRSAVTVSSDVTVFRSNSSPTRAPISSGAPEVDFPLFFIGPIIVGSLVVLSMIAAVVITIAKNRGGTSGGIVYNNGAQRAVVVTQFSPVATGQLATFTPVAVVGGQGGSTSFTPVNQSVRSNADTIIPMAVLAEQDTVAASGGTLYPSIFGAPLSAPPAVPQNSSVPTAKLYTDV